MHHLCVKSGLRLSVFKTDSAVIYGAAIRYGLTERKNEIFFIIKVVSSIHIYKVLRLVFRSDTYLYLRLLQSLFLSSPSHEHKETADGVIRNVNTDCANSFFFLLSMYLYISRCALHVIYVINDCNTRAAFPAHMFTKHTNTLQ
jgi:hypothetical protein